MDHGGEPHVNDQRNSILPTKRRRHPGAHTIMARKAQAAEVSTMARQLRVSAASAMEFGSQWPRNQQGKPRLHKAIGSGMLTPGL